MHPKIIFGLQLSDQILPVFSEPTTGGVYRLGPTTLLHHLEKVLGLSGHPNNNEHLRIEQYRQAIQTWENDHAPSFISASFNADPFAAAGALLELRDELLLAGWNAKSTTDTPERLRMIGALENLFLDPDNDLYLAFGYADRYLEIQTQLAHFQPPYKSIYLNEPLELLPHYLRQIFLIFEQKGIPVKTLPVKSSDLNNDLNQLRRAMSGQTTDKVTLKGDGSLLIVKAKRDTDLATWMAKLLRKNPDFRPACLVPEKNRTLDQALCQEGLPSLGMLSASLARPSLQILKLVPTFVWNPIDPYKIMEFVTLAVKPLADDLAVKIARQMAAIPGLRSDSWFAMQAQYFEKLDERAATDSSINVGEVRSQFNFWFNRRRFNITKSVPKTEVIEIYEYLTTWAKIEFDKSENENTSLLVLAEQSRRIVDLLYALPPAMDFLTNLELERIVRTIYEPSPVTFEEKAVGHLPYTYQPSSVIGSVPQLIWWNFIQNEKDHFFSRWYPNELAYLSKQNVNLATPQDENKLLLWQRNRPFLRTQQQLVLCIPEMVNGGTVFNHPLFDEIQAYTTTLEKVTFNIDRQNNHTILSNFFKLPDWQKIPHRILSKPKPFIKIDRDELAEPNEKESITSLRDLFYYPYMWVFRHKTRLQKSTILSIVKDVTLMGNLSHRFFELLFQEDISEMTKANVEEWIMEKASGLLAKEGAVLLMYGREPEKAAFLSKVKYAAWSLVSLIQQNGWTVAATEQGLGGNFENIPVRGKADLVLTRGKEVAVIDLKWRGATRRYGLIKSEEDLQLVMYAKLIGESDQWTHTAYFILENGQLISRNTLAFKEAIAVSPDLDHREVNDRIWDKMTKTYRWRLAQLTKGDIEVRTETTCPDLEDIYGAETMELLEMFETDAMFDDYRTLINVE